MLILDSFNRGKLSNGVVVHAENKMFFINFDYLDKNNGFAIAIIHDSNHIPKISGSIMGVRIVVDKDGPKITTLKRSSRTLLIVMLPFNILFSFGFVVLAISGFVKGNYWVSLVLMLPSVPLFYSLWKGYVKGNFINVPPKSICVFDSEKESAQVSGD